MKRSSPLNIYLYLTLVSQRGRHASIIPQDGPLVNCRVKCRVKCRRSCDCNRLAVAVAVAVAVVMVEKNSITCLGACGLPYRGTL